VTVEHPGHVTARPNDLPSPASLRKATIVAVVTALFLVVAVVLPAERGIDPTGIGQLVGLKEMGEFKVEAEKEFAETAVRLAKLRADSIAAASGAGAVRPDPSDSGQRSRDPRR
jgi:hypothetical protein